MAATGGYSNSCGEPGFEGTEVSGFRKGAAEEHWEAGVTLTGNIPLPRSFRSLTMIDSPFQICIDGRSDDSFTTDETGR